MKTTGKEGRSPLSRPQTLCLTAAGLSLIAVCYGFARFAYGLFLPAFRNEFELNPATAGTISSASYAAYCLAIVVATVLTPRCGARTLAVAAGTTATAGTLLIAVAPSTVILAVGVVLAGSSTGVASPPLAHAVGHTITAAKQDRVQTVINAGTGFGVLAAGPVALLAQDQWRGAWVTFAILCTVVTAWVAFAVPGGIHTARRRSEAGRRGLRPSPLLPSGSFRLFTAALLMGAGSSAVWTFGRDLLVTVGQMGDRPSTIAWIILGGFGMLGVFAGDLTRRIGVRRAWLVTMPVMAVSTALLAAAPSLVAVAWVASAAFGATYIGLTGLLLIWGTGVYQREPAAGVGLAFLAIALGQTAGAPLIGVLSETYGSQPAFLAASFVAVIGGQVRPSRSTSGATSPAPLTPNPGPTTLLTRGGKWTLREHTWRLSEKSTRTREACILKTVKLAGDGPSARRRPPTTATDNLAALLTGRFSRLTKRDQRIPGEVGPTKASPANPALKPQPDRGAVAEEPDREVGCGHIPARIARRDGR